MANRSLRRKQCWFFHSTWKLEQNWTKGKQHIRYRNTIKILLLLVLLILLFKNKQTGPHEQDFVIGNKRDELQNVMSLKRGGGGIREGELQHKNRGFIREGGLNRAFTVVWVAKRTSTLSKAFSVTFSCGELLIVSFLSFSLYGSSKPTAVYWGGLSHCWIILRMIWVDSPLLEVYETNWCNWNIR